MANKQVYVGKILEVLTIPGADKIEAASVICGFGGRWHGVVQKGWFTAGSPCQVYLPDSLLPQTPEFEFMAKYSYRVRMMKFRGVPSESLIMPQTIEGQIGDDITEQAGVTKYEKPIPTCLTGDVYGDFPSFIPKTDEPNFQRVPEMVEAIRNIPYYVTEKIDGVSGTAYRYNGRFGLCSRNWELRETKRNIFWRCMTDQWRNIPDGYAVQFELAGPGIHGNPMGLKIVQPFCFQVWNIAERQYLSYWEWRNFCNQLFIPMVSEIIGSPANLFDSDETLRMYAEGKYENGKPREGIILRPIVEQRIGLTMDRLSFKVINLLYKEGWKHETA